jgi:glycosyltransferase involved in cell wall biosynthesis
VKPVLLVTNHAPPARVGAFARLHAREGVEVALIGGKVHHAGVMGPASGLPFPARRTTQRGVLRLAASGRHRAVIAGLSGRVALPAAWAGARLAGIPFVLWATIWAHPRTPAHALSYLPLRHLYRTADAVATYGPHVSAYVRAQGARGPVVEAPQAVDAAFWGARAPAPDRRAPFQALFAARLEREKGVEVLLAAWEEARLPAEQAALVVAGEGPLAGLVAAREAVLAVGGQDPGRFLPALGGRGVLAVGRQGPAALRDLYAGSDVVVVPSIPTPTFREPWGLVVNEAFHQGIPVIATDAVGAAAGGLVVHERTGLVVPAGDPGALAAALRRLHADPALRARLGAAAREAVAAYDQEAWAAGMARALALAGAGGSGGGC